VKVGAGRGWVGDELVRVGMMWWVGIDGSWSCARGWMVMCGGLEEILSVQMDERSQS